MFLYNLTLQRTTGVQSSVFGNFSAPKAQEVVVSRGAALELLRPDDTGKLVCVLRSDVFGVIRSLAAFRLAGANRDYLVVGSDSGRVVVLSVDAEHGRFDKVHQETFGKTGCRRIVPGQFLAVDPKGRAIMVGAMEKQKLVYVLNRDTSANLTISSPLEAHKNHTLCFSIAALDCGFENPVFAAIELDYADVDQDSSGEAVTEAQKHLTLYELDLGLNHVVRRWSDPVDNGANLLISVPGGGDGPGGVLVCAENFIIFKNEGHPEVRAVVPRREDLPAERGVLLVAAATHRMKAMFFFLVQSEYGDIYKVTLDYSGEQVSELKVKYFDTIPPCTSFAVLRTGFLFAGSEFGNHALYQFEGIGDGDDVESSSTGLVETEEGFTPVFFTPRPLKNLVLIDDVDSLCPVVAMQAHNLLGEESPQLYSLCGAGPRSTLRVLRHGLALTEMAVSGLPGNPNGVWTVRKASTDEYDAYIVVSFVDGTLVLSIGETVEEVSDSGFLGNTSSLAVCLLGDDSLLQAHPGGLRHIRADKRVNEWKTPGRKAVAKVACNARQAVVALGGGEMVYFELDQTGQLAEVEKRDMGGDVACLALSPIPEGRQRGRFLAVGMFDSTVRVLSVDPEDCMEALAVQALASPPESLLLVPEGNALFLHAGLANGVLLRTEVDAVTGQLTDSRIRFLGPRPARLFSTTVAGQAGLLALSTRPWLGYNDGGRHTLSPLSYEALEYASPFASEQCPEGIVAVAKSTLRVVSLERLGETFNQTVTKLRYTPRAMVAHSTTGLLVIAEAEPGTVPVAKRPHGEASTPLPKPEGEDMQTGEDDDDDEAGPTMSPAEQFGAPRAGPGQWCSCVRLFDARANATSHLLELEGNEAAISLALVTFATAPTEVLLAVGTVVGLTFSPRSADGGFIRIYRFAGGVGQAEEGKPQPVSLELLHATPVDGVPRALRSFKGRLLAGVGNALRLYELGKKKLLRKCENRNFPNLVSTIDVAGDRIYVGDLQESFHFVKYKKEDNMMYVFADDTTPRYITAALHLDYDTMAGADKFGNAFVLRLPQDVSDEVEDDPTGGRLASATSVLNGAPHKVHAVVQFHIGDTVTSLQKVALQAGATESMLYGTVLGAVGALVPFTSREDIDFASHLEMHMRQEAPPLCGRDHLAYRSFHIPVKGVVDGDLCEQFASLPSSTQRSIAENMDRTVGEVLKKLEELRARVC